MTTLLLLALLAAQPPDADAPPRPSRWDGYLGVPAEDGGFEFYAYWIDPDSVLRFRPALPGESGGLGGAPPERLGTELAVRSPVLRALANLTRRPGASDDALAQGGTQVGYSVRGDRVRLIVSQTFSMTVLAVGVAVLLGGLAAVGVAVGARRRLRRERALRAEEAEARRRMESVREAERARLARELHDGPIQDLYALRLQAGAAALRAGAGAGADPLDAGLQEVSRELRAIMEGLRPPALTSFGLVAALDSLAVGADAEVEVVVPEPVAGALARAPEPVQLGVYRIVQEAVNNAVQHGGGRVTVEISADDDRLAVVVVDDGDGFGPEPPEAGALVASGHYGLAGIRERAEILGGALRLGAAPGGGARVAVEIPRPEPAVAA